MKRDIVSIISDLDAVQFSAGIIGIATQIGRTIKKGFFSDNAIALKHDFTQITPFENASSRLVCLGVFGKEGAETTGVAIGNRNFSRLDGIRNRTVLVDVKGGFIPKNRINSGILHLNSLVA